jgi:hypothetical protein
MVEAHPQVFVLTTPFEAERGVHPMHMAISTHNRTEAQVDLDSNMRTSTDGDLVAAGQIIREQAESIERSREQLQKQIHRIDNLLLHIDTTQELQASHAAALATTPSHCRQNSATLFNPSMPSCPSTINPSDAKLISVTQGKRYTYQASAIGGSIITTPIDELGYGGPSSIAAAASLIMTQREEDAPDYLEEMKLELLNGARSVLNQSVEEAQNVRASQADISILMAARDQLISDLTTAKELGLPTEELMPAEFHRRKLHNAIQDLKGQVRVFCRIRPLTEIEKMDGDEEAEGLQVLDEDCVESPLAGVFCFNGVFAPGTQELIFDDCKDLAQSAMDGHNVTIFSYGQTGAGKTFTMYGTPGNEGVATRMVEELFRIINSSHEYRVSVEGSIAELYNNRLIDLISPAGRFSQNPRLREGREGQFQIEDLTQLEVSNLGHLKELIEHGFAQRKVAETSMNAESSRSHLILTVKIVRTDYATGESLSGKLVFCDLGGSERLKKTEAVGERKKEAIEINKSLAALGDVIEAVAAKRKHVPYRNHTLTRILQDSLGGTAKTLMFVHCSPAHSSASETAMSLKFAARAGRIINTAGTQAGGARKRSKSI